MSLYWSGDGIELHLGDCREIDAWLAADVLVTDPPYGMKYTSGRRRGNERIVGDDSLLVRDDALEMWGDKRALVFGTWKQPRPSGVRQLIVWDKRGGAGFSGDLNMPWADVTEEIYVFGQWIGARRPAIYSVPTIASMAADRPNHPTPKPVPLMEKLIAATADFDVIADPFAGSGSTLVAAKLQGRKAIGVELEEKYCEIAARRLDQGVLDFGDGVA